MAKELVIVYQPACATLYLVNGIRKDILCQHSACQHSASYVLAFAAGYNAALSYKYEFVRVAFCVSGDARELPWTYTGTREMLPTREEQEQ